MLLGLLAPMAWAVGPCMLRYPYNGSTFMQSFTPSLLCTAREFTTTTIPTHDPRILPMVCGLQGRGSTPHPCKHSRLAAIQTHAKARRNRQIYHSSSTVYQNSIVESHPMHVPRLLAARVTRDVGHCARILQLQSTAAATIDSACPRLQLASRQ